MLRFILSNYTIQTMKYTTEKTEFLLVKADTTSEWDSVTHALIHDIEKVTESAIKRLALFSEVKEQDESLFLLNFHDARVTFLSLGCEDYDEAIDDVLEMDNFCFVDLEGKEPHEYPKPEAKLKTTSMEIYAYDEFAFSDTNGNVAGEDFWSLSLDPYAILEAINNVKLKTGK